MSRAPSNIAGILCAWALVASGCEAGTDELDGLEQQPQVRTCEFGGVRFPENAVFGSGCNQCRCILDNLQEGQEPAAACTAVLCDPAAPVRCLSDADCGASGGAPSSNVCTFAQGCDGEMGFCMHVQTTCNAFPTPATDESLDAHILCGCDGISYEAPTSEPELVCLRLPWRSLGRCPQAP